MKPDEMKELAQLIQKVPGLKGIDFKEVKRIAELLRELPEIGPNELTSVFGTGVVIPRTGSHAAGAPPLAAPPPQSAGPMASPPAGPEPARAAGGGPKEMTRPTGRRAHLARAGGG